MNKELFSSTCETILKGEYQKNGIGTLQEKTLHKILKCYFEPYEINREVKIGGYVADIVGENGIIEIQTQQFNAMRKKLEVFLSVGIVTVVYPIAHIKWLSWIDTETGQKTKSRKSPKIGQIYSIIDELYKIKFLLTNPNLHFCIALIDMEEYRYLNGWSRDKKKGSSRFDRIPTDIYDEVYIENLNDYLKFIPENLPMSFSSAEYKKSTGLSLPSARTALNVLHYIGVLKRVGKKGNSYLYEKNI
ncbi:MAG: hypothetical protein K0S55_1659 [Clostridia bacterium]|nr:hypothetical protein [Clostridia bacterium]